MFFFQPMHSLDKRLQLCLGKYQGNHFNVVSERIAWKKTRTGVSHACQLMHTFQFWIFYALFLSSTSPHLFDISSASKVGNQNYTLRKEHMCSKHIYQSVTVVHVSIILYEREREKKENYSNRKLNAQEDCCKYSEQ